MRNKAPVNGGSKSFKTQFKVLFDKTFNIFIADGKVFFFPFPCFFFARVFAANKQRRERDDDKNFHLKISSSKRTPFEKASPWCGIYLAPIPPPVH